MVLWNDKHADFSFRDNSSLVFNSERPFNDCNWETYGLKVTDAAGIIFYEFQWPYNCGLDCWWKREIENHRKLGSNAL